MKPKSDLPKIQHYVPQFLLKHFTAGKKHQVWAYDKQRDLSFRTNVKNIAGETGFYDLKFNEANASIEPSLGMLEGKASKVIKRMVKEESLAWISTEDRTVLANFIVVQMMRTRHMREQIFYMDESLQKKLKNMGINPNEIDGYQPIKEKEIAKLISINSLANVKELIPHILAKAWVLLKGNHKNPFYISDNPVTLQNMRDLSPRSNIGLAVEGIEIYLPISSLLVLAMYCPRLVEEVRENHERTKRVFLSLQNAANSLFKDKYYIGKKMIAGFNEGIAVDCEDDNILNLNSLQVRYSEHQVYCEKNSFGLVMSMLKENSDFRTGPRIKIM